MSLEKKVVLDTQDPLLSFREAAAKGDLASVRALLDTHQVRKDQIDQPGSSSGKTALHRAAKNGHNHIIIYLLQNGADPIKVDKEEGQTAFQMYCEKLSSVPQSWVFKVENIDKINAKKSTLSAWELLAFESAKLLSQKKENSGKPLCCCYGSGQIYICTVKESVFHHMTQTQKNI